MSQKQAFLAGVAALLGRLAPVYWSTHPTEGNLVTVTARFLANAAALHDSAGHFHIVVDGYPEKSLQEVRAAFRNRRLAWTKISGHRDEGEPFLRLADALAGFLSDFRKQKAYAVMAWESLQANFRTL